MDRIPRGGVGEVNSFAVFGDVEVIGEDKRRRHVISLDEEVRLSGVKLDRVEAVYGVHNVQFVAAYP